MINDPIDKYFGIPMSEWIDRVPNELEVDAVGLWQIIPTGRDSFNLSGEELEDFARRCIIALIAKGASPVRPATSNDGFWQHQPQYGKSPEEVANKIIEEWKNSETEPNHDGIWFSLIKNQKPQ